MKIRFSDNGKYCENKLYSTRIGDVFLVNYFNKDRVCMRVDPGGRLLTTVNLESGELVVWGDTSIDVKVYNMVFNNLSAPLEYVDYHKLKGGDVFSARRATGVSEYDNNFLMVLSCHDNSRRDDVVLDLGSGKLIIPINKVQVTLHNVEGLLSVR